MKKEFEASWYDDAYKKGGHKREYFNSPEKSIYYPLRKKILETLTNKDAILEIGCGSGQLAKMILDSNFNYIKGFDFSAEGIRLCKSFLSKEHHSKFEVGNVYDSSMYEIEYNTIICCEVFEHLDNDLGILDNIEEGTRIIFTVPNFNSKSHVRYFKDVEKVRERYIEKADILSIEEIYISKVNKIYLVYCIKK